MKRTDAEVASELHALNELATNSTILTHERENEDRLVLDCIRAQISVIEEQMTYNQVMDKYEEIDGSEDSYVLRAAYDAYLWFREDDEAPSYLWEQFLETLTPIAA